MKYLMHSIIPLLGKHNHAIRTAFIESGHINSSDPGNLANTAYFTARGYQSRENGLFFLLDHYPELSELQRETLAPTMQEIMQPLFDYCDSHSIARDYDRGKFLQEFAPGTVVSPAEFDNEMAKNILSRYNSAMEAIAQRAAAGRSVLNNLISEGAAKEKNCLGQITHITIEKNVITVSVSSPADSTDNTRQSAPIRTGLDRIICRALGLTGITVIPQSSINPTQYRYRLSDAVMDKIALEKIDIPTLLMQNLHSPRSSEIGT